MSEPTAWSQYIVFLFKWEGRVYEYDRNDPGGETKFGIDKRSHPGVNIPHLDAEEAAAIHLEDYRKTKAPRLPFPVNYAFFDFAMNAGEKAAVKAMQRAIGCGVIDGIWGSDTQNKLVIALTDPAMFLLKYADQRAAFYKNLTWGSARMARYLDGWLNRTRDCRTWCVARLGQKGDA